MKLVAAAPRKLDDKSALLAADVVRLTMLEHVISKEDWVMVEPQMASLGPESCKSSRRSMIHMTVLGFVNNMEPSLFVTTPITCIMNVIFCYVLRMPYALPNL